LLGDCLRDPGKAPNLWLRPVTRGRSAAENRFGWVIPRSKSATEGGVIEHPVDKFRSTLAAGTTLALGSELEVIVSRRATS
jgi:hypothetical protein